jgi:Na+/melibiose symporter-like transporter
MLNVTFTVIMNAIAGPRGRYALLSRRWSVIGLTSAIMALAAGEILDLLPFPLNYQVTFILFSLIGLVIGSSFSRRYQVEPQTPPPPAPSSTPWRQRLRESVGLIWREKPFVSMMGKRLVFVLGTWLVAPLFSLYYVREVQASDAWIGWIATASKFALLIGYALWTRQRDRRGSRFVLLATTLGSALYPALVALSRNEVAMLVLAALDGILMAGLNLVFFDELMKTIPVENSALFVGISMSLQHLMAVIGPLLNTRLADFIGLGWALALGAAVRFIGFLLFYLSAPTPDVRETQAQPAS